MNIAVLLAGGTGQRLGAQVPKQFVEILKKPVIVYISDKTSMVDAYDSRKRHSF